MSAVLIPVTMVSLIGVLSGIILTLAAKFMHVPVDEQVEKVREILPGVNCGACGYAGCDEYAEKLVHSCAKSNLCTPGGPEVAVEICKLLGIEYEAVVEKHAIVKCASTTETTKYIMDYQGPQSCEGNNSFYQGRRSCSHSCLGHGDCVDACRYGALSIIDGVAVVDHEACTGCTMCVSRCPKGLIEIAVDTSEIWVACSSHDKGAFVRSICKAGCIGCMRCKKACEYGALQFNDFLASVDPAKCTNCGKCLSVCPTKVIRSIIPQA